MKRFPIVLIMAGIFSASPLLYAADKVVVIPLNTAKKLQNVISVSSSGGNFTNPVDAINSINDASATNPYLIAIGPGRYLLSTTLVMKPYVSITGAGEKATILYGFKSSDSFNVSSSIIKGASNTSLSNLTIENYGGGVFSTAIYNYQASPDIHNVNVVAKDSTYVCGIQNENFSSPSILDVIVNISGAIYGYGIRNIDNCSPFITNTRSWSRFGTHNHGLYNDHSSPLMKNVDLRGIGTSTGYGIRNTNTSGSYHPVVQNSYIGGGGASGAYGIYNFGDGQTDVSHSHIRGSTYGVFSINSGTLFADWSTIDGTVFGTAACFGSKSINRVALDTNCQPPSPVINE